MDLNLIDHLLSLFLLVLMPIWGIWDFQGLEARIQSGQRDARIRGYRKIIIIEWALAVVIFGTWATEGRPWRDMGITFALADWWWLGGLLTVLASLFMVIQFVAINRDPSKLASLRDEFQSLRSLLPENDRETRWFNALSVTAGICEEVIYRGFLIAYFAAFVGLVPAAIISSFVFGLGHAYQGWRGIVKTGVIGLVFAGIYLLTGSLWAPIVVHVLLDITSGMLGRRAIESVPPLLETRAPLGQE